MLEFDECDQILVTNPFADDGSTVSSGDDHDGFVTLTLGGGGSASSGHHPLRSRSVSPARRCDAPNIPFVTVIGSDGETRAGLTNRLSLDGLELSAKVAPEEEEDQTAANESDTILHPVGPNDSFAGVALRYGVSIAALRRANQLWPSDPIHLRTELVVPRGDTLCTTAGRRSSSPDAGLRSTVEPTPTPSLSPDLVASSFVAARNMILSVLPARISMESLSSKASASEDHELDEFQRGQAWARGVLEVVETPLVGEGHELELSVLGTPHARYGQPGVALSSQSPYSSTDKHLVDHHILSANGLRSRSISSSPGGSLEQVSRARPFAVLPLRTSQLEPEPAMELPVRRPRM